MENNFKTILAMKKITSSELGDSSIEIQVKKSSLALQQKFYHEIMKYGFPKLAIVTGTAGPFKEIGKVEGVQYCGSTFYDKIKLPTPKTPGHEGEISIVLINKKPVFVCSGRVHSFETDINSVVQMVRTLGIAGVETIILTNASGSLNPSHYPVGSIIAIEDHINRIESVLTGPLNALNQYADMSQCYSPKLLNVYNKMLGDNFELFKKICPQGISTGVYLAVRGREFETQAEIRKCYAPIADLIGMSTVPEVIAGNQMGLNMFALSYITNLGAGLSDKPVDHKENLREAKSREQIFEELIVRFVTKLMNDGF